MLAHLLLKIPHFPLKGEQEPGKNADSKGSHNRAVGCTNTDDKLAASILQKTSLCGDSVPLWQLKIRRQRVPEVLQEAPKDELLTR